VEGRSMTSFLVSLATLFSVLLIALVATTALAHGTLES
jgi:hypothetical protein